MDDTPEWDRPVFLVRSRKFTIRDVITAAHFRGDLDSAWAEVCRLANRSDFEADEDESQARSEQFRSERDLITAEETERWLEQHGLTLDEFSDYFARHQGDAPDAQEGPTPPPYEDAPAELQDLLRIDLILSGAFETLAERLAWRLAAHDASGDGKPRDWIEELCELEAAYQAQSVSVLTDRARNEALQSLRLALTRFEIELLELESRDAANEALLCLRVDGESMADVARDGHYPLRRLEVHVDEVPGEVQSSLLSASLGEVLGPFARQEEYLLYRLLRKIEPRLDDDSVRRSVDKFIIGRHFSELTAQQVHWILTPASLYAAAS